MAEEPIFQAGAAEADITPPLGVALAGQFNARRAEDVHDPLYVKAVVLDDGSTRLAMILLDLILIMREEVEKIRSQVSERVGIPPEHVMVACTHTHTGPFTRKIPARNEAYIDWLITRAADTVVMAVNRLQPARISWGRGEQHDISFCRRFLMRDGTVRTNPPVGDPDIVKPTSPIDPAVGVLYIEDMQGNPLAVVAQFSLHYVGTDDEVSLSADYYGHFAQIMRQHLGPDCIPFLFNGTSGQIIARNAMERGRDRGHAKGRRVAMALAGEVIKVISREPLTQECSLKGMSVDVEFTMKSVTEQDVKIAEQILAGSDPSPDKGPFSYVVGQPIPERLRRPFASHVIGISKMPKTIIGEIQAFRIGDSAWVALPGEIFTEIGLAIKDKAPTSNTFVIGLANDGLGYICTDHAILNEGGYETWARTGSAVGIGAEKTIVQTSGSLLNQLFGEDSAG